MQKIIIAEPESVINMDLKVLLNNYSITCSKLLQIPDLLESEKFDLVIVHTTENNIGLFKTIRKNYNIPVILITSSAIKDLSSAKKSVDEVFTIPFSNEQLLECVRILLIGPKISMLNTLKRNIERSFE